MHNIESSLSSFRYAYVFYAANFEYLCSALALLKLLKALRTSSQGQLNVDYVLTYVKSDFKSKKAKDALDKWAEWGGLLRNFTSLRRKSHVRGYYEVTKLKSCFLPVSSFHYFSLYILTLYFLGCSSKVSFFSPD